MKDYSENFEAWAAECVKITDKRSGLPVPFILNAPQRRVAAVMEEMRRSGEPIRLIMLKARQWGGSTLVQVYMAWMQLVVRRGWNSLICAHVKDASAGIRGMYSQLLRLYPEELKEGEARDWAFAPYEKSQSVSWIPARGAQVAVATALAPNTVRGTNFAMAHLSEVAFWADGDESAAEEIVRTVCGSVAREPDTLVVMESTANGTDNFFHSEWRRAVEGKSDKRAIFVGWHEIDIYRKEIPASSRESTLAAFDDYERGLLDRGIEAERVAWYHDKRREYPSHEAMMAEFPTTPEEAFANSRRDSLLDADDVACVSDTSGEADLAVGVCGPKGSRQTLSLFRTSGGRLVSLGEAAECFSATELARRGAEISKAWGCGLLIAEAGGEGFPSSAVWCAGEAERSGAILLYDENETPFLLLDGSRRQEGAELYADLTRRGLTEECSEEARSELLKARKGALWRTPLAVARLAAAIACTRRHEASVSIYDFIGPGGEERW